MGSSAGTATQNWEGLQLEQHPEEEGVVGAEKKMS